MHWRPHISFNPRLRSSQKFGLKAKSPKFGAQNQGWSWGISWGQCYKVVIILWLPDEKRPEFWPQGRDQGQKSSPMLMLQGQGWNFSLVAKQHSKTFVCCHLTNDHIRTKDIGEIVMELHSKTSRHIKFIYLIYFISYFMSSVLVSELPSVLWRCWLGVRKGIQPIKIWLMRCWHGYLLEQSANSLHMVQLMPLPPYHVCFSKIQNGYPSGTDSPG